MQLKHIAPPHIKAQLSELRKQLVMLEELRKVDFAHYQATKILSWQEWKNHTTPLKRGQMSLF